MTSFLEKKKFQSNSLVRNIIFFKYLETMYLPKLRITIWKSRLHRSIVGDKGHRSALICCFADLMKFCFVLLVRFLFCSINPKPKPQTPTHYPLKPMRGGENQAMFVDIVATPKSANEKNQQCTNSFNALRGGSMEMVLKSTCVSVCQCRSIFERVVLFQC